MNVKVIAKLDKWDTQTQSKISTSLYQVKKKKKKIQLWEYEVLIRQLNYIQANTKQLILRQEVKSQFWLLINQQQKRKENNENKKNESVNWNNDFQTQNI